MAQLQVMTLDNLILYDELIKGYIDTADAKSLKTVAIDGNKLKFYKITEPVEGTDPAYEITLPSTDISGLLAKLTTTNVGNVTVTKADGTIEDGGVKLADLALKSDVEDAIDEITNADTGILKTATDYADEKIKELADGQVKTNTEAIATLNGTDTEDGSVAKAVKDSADAINAKIGTLADLDTTAKTDLVNAINEVRAAVDAGGTGSQVTMTTDTTTEGYLKTYTIKQGSTEVGKIDIPKDLVVASGEIVVDPDGQPSGTYVKLTIANQEAPVYINVADLVDAYTAQASATQVQLAISDTNEISATIVAGSVGTAELADNAITTAKIADANVTLAKLGADVTPTLTQVETNKTDIATLKGLVGEGYAAISTDDINGLFA